MSIWKNAYRMSGMPAVTGFVRGMGASSTDDVLKNAQKRWSPNSDKAIGQRLEDSVRNAAEFEQNMRNNPNIRPDDYDDFRKGFEMSNSVGEAVDNVTRRAGQAQAAAAGLAGYAAKQAVVAPIKFAANASDAVLGRAVGSIKASRAAERAKKAEFEQWVSDPTGNFQKRIDDVASNATSPEQAAAIRRDPQRYMPQEDVERFRTAEGERVGRARAAAEKEQKREERQYIRNMEREERAENRRWAKDPDAALRDHINLEAGKADNAKQVLDLIHEPEKHVPQYVAGKQRQLSSAADRAALKREGMAFYNLANSKTGALAMVGAGTMIGFGEDDDSILGLAYKGGMEDYERKEKYRQIAGNMTTSSDGGGAFIRNVGSPTVDNMGATGDLVFALHSLRNGG